MKKSETLHSATAGIQHICNEETALGNEQAIQVCAFLDGSKILSINAGGADNDSLISSWSVTKGFVSTCMHILADRDVVRYDDAISRYWPEFGARGKKKITIQHALTHQMGIPQMPESVDVDLICYWDSMCAAIAEHQPLWEPGDQTGYHFWTSGWVLGELLRRVDGRDIATFARQELCDPLGIEHFYLGCLRICSAR